MLTRSFLQQVFLFALVIGLVLATGISNVFSDEPELPVLSFALGSETPEGKEMTEYEHAEVAVISAVNSSESETAYIDEGLAITRYGTAIDNDVNYVSVYYGAVSENNLDHAGYGYFKDGKVEIYFFTPIVIGPLKEIKISLRSSVRELAKDNATFALGINSVEDIFAHGFEINGTFPIKGNEFTIDNPPRPKVELDIDKEDSEYNRGDAMLVTAIIENPTVETFSGQMKSWLTYQDGSPIGKAKWVDIVILAGEQLVEIIYESDDIPHLWEGWYYWNVILYDTSGEDIDRDSEGWRYREDDPSIEVEMDDVVYKTGDAMYVRATVDNPTWSALKTRAKAWLTYEDGSLVEKVRSRIIEIPSGKVISGFVYKTQKLKELKPGWYYWHVAIYYMDNNEKIDEDSYSWRFTE
ncbi:hypothetical protein CL633_03565 [bacterium]|nr:hypothetical protein [bacterium]|tara:strand:+ start:4018 stop:5247 length:1230 start_codon:yes stop_codon:yes gene_type:complete